MRPIYTVTFDTQALKNHAHIHCTIAWHAIATDTNVACRVIAYTDTLYIQSRPIGVRPVQLWAGEVTSQVVTAHVTCLPRYLCRIRGRPVVVWPI